MAYDKYPSVVVPGRHPCLRGWSAIANRLQQAIAGGARRIVIDCYPGVDEAALISALRAPLACAAVSTAAALADEATIRRLQEPFIGGDDPIFGFLTNLQLPDFFDAQRLAEMRQRCTATDGPLLVVGVGAGLVCDATDKDLLILADLPRWEIQGRQRRGEFGNLGLGNAGEAANLLYKRAYFIDWRVADRHKRSLLDRCDLLLDSTRTKDPKLIGGEALRAGLAAAARQPFRVVPFFDPAPWGGEWMRRTCELPPEPPNFGWCFDCVPEENSLVLRVDGVDVEIPALDLVLHEPVALLGDRVHGRFGAEFPIRFDFLDTIEGGNLSFQVHPLTDYMHEHFGLAYTQDESYYLLDATPDAAVYLGLQPGVDPAAMRADLAAAERGERPFPAERYTTRWPAKKHDHFLIPAGTCHCSGAGSMVLEISATPYIFTFKLWDWGRLGLDGKPRPINCQRGLANICWERDSAWTERELINRIEPLDAGSGWHSERTGLHRREFIDTVRHWFTVPVLHERDDSVDVLNLVEGAEACIESPDHAFEPFTLHYAETVIIPAAAGPYRIRPDGPAADTRCATIRARVR